MCTPLACSDYYGASAPPAALGRRRTCPAHRTGCPVTRAATGGSHVPCMPIGQDGRPTVPRQPRRAYAADLQHGLPTHRLSGFRSRPPRFRTAAHCSPARIRQVGAGTTLTGLCTLVSRVRLLALLAGPAPSGSADASRRCRGCLPTSPASPGSVCPQLLPDRCDDPAVVVFHLHSVMQSFVAHQPVVEVSPGGRCRQRRRSACRSARQVQQPIPVGVVAGQPGHLHPEHDPDLAQPDVRRPTRGTPSGRSRAPRTAQIGVDHHAPRRRPAQRDRPFAQLVLAHRGLGVRTTCSGWTGAHTHTRRGTDARR